MIRFKVGKLYKNNRTGRNFTCTQFSPMSIKFTNNHGFSLWWSKSGAQHGWTAVEVAKKFTISYWK